MRKQKGITLSGFLLWAIVLVFAGLMGLKVGPAYFEYMSIQKQLKAIISDPGRPINSLRDAQVAFSSRASVENITSLGVNDLELTKDGARVTLSASYTTCVPLIANMRACMDFYPSTDK
jgi:hypothetical protein